MSLSALKLSGRSFCALAPNLAAMIFNGRAFAADWQNRLKKKLADQKVALAVVLVGEDPASQAFVKIKQKFGEAIGVEVSVREYDEAIATGELIEIIEKLNDNSRFAGIIVQLPLPASVDTGAVVAAIAPAKDVDALGSGSLFTPPTVRVIEEVFKSINLGPAGHPALVIGQGRLVGRPAAAYLAQVGAQVEIADKYDHKHQAESFDNPEKGLSKMSLDISRSIFSNLASDGTIFNEGIFRSIKAIYHRIALDMIEQYNNDAEMNGFSFDRYKEERIVDQLSKNVYQAGVNYLNNPYQAPTMPSWNRVINAIPKIEQELFSIVEKDNQI